MRQDGDTTTMDLFSAREEGERAAQACVAKAERVTEFDGERAREFVLAHLGAHGAQSGELIVNAAKKAGHIPHDDRAFGAVFGVLSRRSRIRVVGTCDRAKGHGTAGARVWALVR